MRFVDTGDSQRFIDKLAEGVATVARAIQPRPVVVRLSDFKTNEYRELKGGDKYEIVEENPMLGWRGCSRYISKWYQAAFSSATGEVRDELNRRTLDEVFVPDDSNRSPRREIAAKLDSAVRSTLAARGIELVDSTFGNLQLPREVTTQRTSMWQAGLEKESTISRATSEADSLLQIQTVYAEAQADVIKAIAQAARMMDENNHLSQPVMKALAHVIERTVQREAVLPLLSVDTRKEVEQSLEQLRQSMLPPGS